MITALNGHVGVARLLVEAKADKEPWGPNEP